MNSTGSSFESRIPLRRNDQKTIAHVLPWASIGGTELQTLRLAEESRRLGFTNIMYVPEGAHKVRSLFEDESFPVFEYEQIQPSYTKPGRFLRNARRIARLIRTQQIDLLHCADIPAAHFTCLAGRLAKVKVISHVRNHYPEIARRDKGFLLPVQRFVFVSSNTRDIFGMARARRLSSVLYDVPGINFRPGVDRDRARMSFGVPRDAYVFGMAARVSPQKDFETLIKAAEEVITKMPEAYILIAGDYTLEASHRDHFQALQPLLEKSAARDRLVFAGFQSEMSRFYGAIDCFVLSTNWEGLPTVVLEAMAYRKPVVCTDVGGIREAVQDGENGFLSSPKCASELGMKMINLAQDEVLTRKFVENALITVHEKFGPERFSQQVWSLYSNLLASHSS